MIICFWSSVIVVAVSWIAKIVILVEKRKSALSVATTIATNNEAQEANGERLNAEVWSGFENYC